MKEIRTTGLIPYITLGLIPFHQSIIQLCIQRFLLLQLRKHQMLSSVSVSGLLSFQYFVRMIKKMKRKLLEMGAAM